MLKKNCRLTHTQQNKKNNIKGLKISICPFFSFSAIFCCCCRTFALCNVSVVHLRNCQTGERKNSHDPKQLWQLQCMMTASVGLVRHFMLPTYWFQFVESQFSLYSGRIDYMNATTMFGVNFFSFLFFSLLSILCLFFLHADPCYFFLKFVLFGWFFCKEKKNPVECALLSSILFYIAATIEQLWNKETNFSSKNQHTT